MLKKIVITFLFMLYSFSSKFFKFNGDFMNDSISEFNAAVKLFDNNRRKMAEALGVSVQSVQYWSKTGKVPALRVYQIQDIIGARNYKG